MSNRLPLEGDCLNEDTTFISLGFKREAARVCVGTEGSWRKPSVGEGSGKIFLYTPKSRCPQGQHESNPLRSD